MQCLQQITPIVTTEILYSTTLYFKTTLDYKTTWFGPNGQFSI